MKRKTSTVPTKIWSFGALAPAVNQQLFLEQLFLGNRYYNSLIEIERRRREKFRAARSEAAPTLAMLETQWKALDAELAAGIEALPKVKGKKKLPPELLALKERRKDVSARMKAERETFTNDPHAKIAIQAVDEAAQLEVKAARAATDLYWGSYLLIEKQIEQARKSKLDPRFRRFEGNGRVGVQLQGGLSLAELQSGEDTRLRLVPRTTPTKSRNPKAKHDLHIRIGSDGRAPVWAVLPVVIHREIPADAKIQWAWIKVEVIGGTRKYFLQIAMESESFDYKHRPAGNGTVAINFGWRAKEDGSRRVAYAVDDAGNEQEYCVPATVERRIEYTNGLRSARDTQFEEARRALGAWMALHEVPEWLKEETTHIWQWRSPKRLAKIAWRLTDEHLKQSTDAERWVTERLASRPKKDLFAPAAEIFEWLGNSDTHALAIYLQLWRKKDLHLWRWEAHQRARAIAHRDDLFRVWARRLADRYSEIRIEDFDLRKMAQIPEPDQDPKHKWFRVARAVAAPGEFRSKLAEAAGPKLVKAPAHGNTVTCYHCRHTNERSLERMMTCGGCNESFDQDANNCRNQLRERPDGEQIPGGARKTPKHSESVGGSGNVIEAAGHSTDIVAAE